MRVTTVVGDKWRQGLIDTDRNPLVPLTTNQTQSIRDYGASKTVTIYLIHTSARSCSKVTRYLRRQETLHSATLPPLPLPTRAPPADIPSSSVPIAARRARRSLPPPCGGQAGSCAGKEKCLRKAGRQAYCNVPTSRRCEETDPPRLVVVMITFPFQKEGRGSREPTIKKVNFSLFFFFPHVPAPGASARIK